jgi:hypothetical protein
VILRVAGRTVRGPPFDLRREPVDPEALVAAIRGEPSPYLAVVPPAGPVHERVGHVRLAMGLRTRTALAEAARSRGLAAPQDDELGRVREELRSFEPPEPADPPEAPPREEIDRLRGRVAQLRGRVRTLSEGEGDGDPAAARERLREAAGRLSELETRRIARVETRDRTRDRRDRRERRLRLEDRVANLERAARAHLVDLVEPAFRRAVATLGGPEDPFAADPVTAALATVRVAEIRAPVVLAVDRFPDPGAALRTLDAPIVRP